MILSIAWKNIWRSKVRSLVVIVATILGLLGGTFAAAFMFGMTDQRLNAAISKETSHIQVHDPRFPENDEIQFVIPGADSLLQEIRNIPGVAAAASRACIPGMISSANASSGIQIMGIDPEQESRVTTIHKTVCDSCGTYFREDRKNPVLISRKLADKLKVRLRSKIVIRFQDEEGNLVDAAFRVCGLYRTSNGMFDEREVFVRKDDLTSIFGKEAPVHEIAVLLSDPDSLYEVGSRIRELCPDLEVQTWMEIQPELALLVTASDQMMYIFLGIILLALAFGIVNTMLMAVLERTKEIVMLMSIGMSKSRIFRMILLETVLLTLTGGIVGMAVSALLIAVFNRYGIDLSIVGEGMEALGYEAMVYPSITVAYFIILTIMILVTGIVSSVYPARKALSIEPAKAIKIE